MKDNTYNGWTNYETWNWKLWIDNDPGTYEYWRETAQELLSAEIEPDYDWQTADDVRRSQLAEMLQQDADEMQENMGIGTAGPLTDLLGAAIDRINWHEIAESILDESRED